MSQGARLPLAEARRLADELRDRLAPASERIEVAGSIRRGKAEVGDIEIVAAPRIEDEPTGLWGEPSAVDRLQQAIDAALADGWLAVREVEIHRADGTIEYGRRNGASYKALVYGGMPVDLFIVRPPAEWGVIFAIRTGPGDWNERIVTDCQRFNRRVEKGQVLHFGRPVPCPEEADFFAAVGQPWIDPEHRSLARVQLRPPTSSVSTSVPEVPPVSGTVAAVGGLKNGSPVVLSVSRR